MDGQEDRELVEVIGKARRAGVGESGEPGCLPLGSL